MITELRYPGKMYSHNKKIIIVGGTGFLGYHLCKKFIQKNWTVISLSRKKPTKLRKIKKVTYKLIDIGKKNLLIKLLKKIHNVDYIINLGGEVEHTKKKKTFLSHYNGTLNLSNFYSKKKIKKFIQVGSSMEYGKLKSPQNEKSVSKPVSNYGKAKALATNKLLDLNKKFFFPVTILRLYQVYGTHQDTNRLIPAVIKNCIKSRDFPCSSGTQYRDFLHVNDFVNAVIKCLNNKNTNGQILNIGCGKPKQIKEIINYIKKKCKSGNPIFGKIKLRNEENLVTFPDIKKAFNFLNWKPKIDLDTGLEKVIDHYRGYKNI